MAINVLIADDSLFMRKVLGDILRKECQCEVQCHEAVNGEEAFEKYKQINPDIVIMDITMPVTDGLTAMRHIIAYNENAKIIMCTASSSQEMSKEAYSLGAKDYIVKPFQPEQIVQAVEKAMPVSA